MLLFDDSSLVTGGVTDSLDCIRWEDVDGLRIIVMIKPSSGDGEEFDFWVVGAFLKYETVVFFGLLPALIDEIDDVGDGVKDRSCFDVIDLFNAEPGKRRCDVDCARCRRSKSSSTFSSWLSNIFTFTNWHSKDTEQIDQSLFISLCLRHIYPLDHIFEDWFVEILSQSREYGR